jgi:streptogramin lyase
VAYSLSGIQEDAQGRMWMNYWQYDGQNVGSGGLVYIDMATMQVSQPFDIGCQNSTCRGMSVDLNGMIWSTSMASNTAFRFNPDTLQIDTYNQLVGPYTYSDMTGWGIQSATCGPQG